MRRHGWPELVLLLAGWLATRTVLFVLATSRGAPGYHGDIGIYQQWYDCCLAHAAFPAADPKWQYPPGAAIVFWLPGVIPGGYVRNFTLFMLACDLAVLALLARRRLSAAWYWTCGVPLLGSLILTRFDLVPVALSVAALCAARSPGARGALAAAGAAVKVWPALLLAGTPPGQWRRTLACAVAVAAAICVVLIGGARSFVAHQNARGVEVEAVAATPFMIWRLAGWHGKIAMQFGAKQLDGAYAWVARDASLLAMALALALLLAWRLLIRSGRATWRPEFVTDAPLAATLLFLVTNSVLSPQYLLWPLGLAAACLAAPRTTQRAVAVLVLIAAGLTQAIFPFGWAALLSGSQLLTAVLTLRNLLLLVAAVLSVRLIGKATNLRTTRGSTAGPLFHVRKVLHVGKGARSGAFFTRGPFSDMGTHG